MAAKAAVLRCSPEQLVVENAENDKETNKTQKDREMYLGIKWTPMMPMIVDYHITNFFKPFGQANDS